MGTLKIISPGILSTIQDIGRIGYQKYGVSVSGAADIYSLQLANILVGNDRYEACIEATMIGPTIQFLVDSVIAITGADMNAKLNSSKINMNETIFVKNGDILEMFSAKIGFRTYIAVQGGFNISKVMGSKSTYLRAGIGGYKGRKLMAGDEIYINKSTIKKEYKQIPNNMLPVYKNNNEILVILGTEEEEFKKEGLNTFLNNEYTISAQSDRMGLRLKGKPIEHKESSDIISAGISLGAIQIPSDGQPIIMLADRQTTGGYTKIANVVSVDIPKLAQIKPGDKISFKSINVEKAHELIKKQEEEINKIMNNKNIKYYTILVNNKRYNVSVEETY